MYDDDEVRSLVPYRPYGLTGGYSKHPLTALAEAAPNYALNVMNGQISLERLRSRHGVLNNACNAMASAACTWLSRRPEGEHNFDMECDLYQGDSGWFGCGQSFRGRMRIKTW